MITAVGKYHNGYVEFDEEYTYTSDEPVEVIVTFLGDVNLKSEKVLTLSDFSFAKSQKILKNVTSSLADELIEERRFGR